MGCRPQEKCKECLCWKCTDHKTCNLRLFLKGTDSCDVVLKCSSFKRNEGVEVDGWYECQNCGKEITDRLYIGDGESCFCSALCEQTHKVLTSYIEHSVPLPAQKELRVSGRLHGFSLINSKVPSEVLMKEMFLGLWKVLSAEIEQREDLHDGVFTVTLGWTKERDSKIGE